MRRKQELSDVYQQTMITRVCVNSEHQPITTKSCNNVIIEPA